MKNKQPQSIRFDTDVEKEIRRLAKDEDRSIAKVVNRLLRQVLKLPAQKK